MFNISEHFESLRQLGPYHLGLGDIRLTLADQEEIVEQVELIQRTMQAQIDALMLDTKHGGSRENDIPLTYADWASEYYPVPADDQSLDTDVKRVQHAMRKFEGLHAEVLKRRGLAMSDRWLEAKTLDGRAVRQVIDGDSCALCVAYIHTDCEDCPLAIARGGCACDEKTGQEKVSPYDAFLQSGTTAPMLEWLGKALTVAQERDAVSEKGHRVVE